MVMPMRRAIATGKTWRSRAPLRGNGIPRWRQFAIRSAIRRSAPIVVTSDATTNMIWRSSGRNLTESTFPLPGDDGLTVSEAAAQANAPAAGPYIYGGEPR